MDFIQSLHDQLNTWHLLRHPFYQAWNKGELSRPTLQTYAQEYYQHVAAFPRYISAIHSNCFNLADRQILLGNLIEEEQGSENHPELWQRFAEGLGVARDALQTCQLSATHALVDGYFDLTRTDYATGLGALYAYERQTPEVAQSKIKGLAEHYNIVDDRTVKFFSVHQQADEWHTAEIEGLINTLPESAQIRVKDGAITGAKLLWGFLDEMMDIHYADSNH